MEALNSCLYECAIFHERLTPKKHAFTNRCFFFYLDLDELQTLANRFRLFNIEKPALYQFKASDHMPLQPTGSLKERAIQAFRQAGLQEPIEKISLLANVRTLGYVFNPISLFFAFNPAGQCLGSLAQVENTFREMKIFPALNRHENESQGFFSEVVKHFYVSPYSKLDQQFRFGMSVPGKSIHCTVSSHAGEETVLRSGFSGKKIPLSDAHLWRLTLRYPLITWQVTALIHLHALVLWLKKVPLHLKEDRLFEQRNVLRPRPDLQIYYAENEVTP
ncbi:DUF1365 domain-containing protein [Vampirovibrio sp.]|uniref:DUF1365 domain-containing protein n=1 Tax=Vampirovibrio sp. TaxID=2717857 RepID=UPI0035935BD4